MTPKHIVAVAGLVVDDSGRVLMLRNLRGDWEFPGGQVEQGENLIEALQREVLEETGIKVCVGELVGVYSNVKTCIVMLDFLCKKAGGSPRVNQESLEVEWVEPYEALARIRLAPIHARMKSMLEFSGQAIYRAYRFDQSASRIEYAVHEERPI